MQFFIFHTKLVFFLIIIILFHSGCPTAVFSRPGKVGQMCFCPNPYCPPNGTVCSWCVLCALDFDVWWARCPKGTPHVIQTERAIWLQKSMFSSTILSFTAILDRLKFLIGKSRCWSVKFTWLAHLLGNAKASFWGYRLRERWSSTSYDPELVKKSWQFPVPVFFEYCLTLFVIRMRALLRLISWK